MIERLNQPLNITSDVALGKQLVLLSGPCVVESWKVCKSVAEVMVPLCQDLGIAYVFKSSYDKANRTSSDSFRSIGIDESLEILHRVKDLFNVPIVTDVHEPHQVDAIKQIADVIQIPAFLCRQTDLLIAAGETGKAVNIKKGQFMAATDMQYAVEKVRSTGNQKVMLTERGVSFGYHNLVVDMRSLPLMRQFCPVIFDVTHSVQQPGGAGGSSGGQREFASYLASAAAAVGVDGFFIETHPNPDQALSDGPNMIPLNEMPGFLTRIKRFWDLQKEITINS